MGFREVDALLKLTIGSGAAAKDSINTDAKIRQSGREKRKPSIYTPTELQKSSSSTIESQNLRLSDESKALNDQDSTSVCSSVLSSPPAETEDEDYSERKTKLKLINGERGRKSKTKIGTKKKRKENANNTKAAREASRQKSKRRRTEAGHEKGAPKKSKSTRTRSRLPDALPLTPQSASQGSTNTWSLNKRQGLPPTPQSITSSTSEKEGDVEISSQSTERVHNHQTIHTPNSNGVVNLPSPASTGGRKRKERSYSPSETTPTKRRSRDDQSTCDRSKDCPSRVADSIPTITETQFTKTPDGQVHDLSILKLAEQIYDMSHTPLDAKPDPKGSPLVWAADRQGMNETLPYWRSQQGSVHQHQGLIRGMMFDAGAHPRDVISTAVCIVRGAGGKHKDEDGDMVHKKDQDASKQIITVKNNMQYEQPVVLVVGDKNPALHFKPKSTYSVLDAYQFTDYWYEKDENGRAIARFRLQHTQPHQNHWFTPKDAGTTGRPDLANLIGTLPPPYKRSCPSCDQESYQVYVQGWMCHVRMPCQLFGRLTDGREPLDSELRYDPRFLLRKQEFQNTSPPFSITPLPFQMEHESVMGGSFSKGASMGICCPRCGMCQIRVGWSHWKCKNENCDEKREFPNKTFPASVLKQWEFPRNGGFAPNRDEILEAGLGHVEKKVCFEKGHRFNVFKLPGNQFVQTGFLVHMVANDDVNSQPNGPDEHFEAVQRVDVTTHLRRELKTDGRCKSKPKLPHISLCKCLYCVVNTL